ncbi:putative fatty acyl-CoA reductase CG5065 [Danaus plexippus]|uniref:putative fatty acyl-CoA reductase CG5065 n=1 Tax=Danaus plexippus TaxID=13037 RepID=UPI002AB3286A|nr:putative fatty acyl-CoA reductase CG5065 [Danaus plexippus]
MVPTSNYTPVSDFYNGKTIFVTGGTGFLGKVLIEKLLYSCPGISKIYMLVREKRNLTATDRMKKFFDCPVFDRLKKEKPDNLKKLKPVNGDLSQPCLGIDPKELQVIKDEVTIVFHFAATVKFNEPLSIAMKINVEGTEQVIDLCHSLKKIEVFVYMSTIFSNTDDKLNSVEERLYRSPKEVDEIYKMIKENDPREVFNPEVLDGRPNTYTFTKAVAENIVAQKRGNLPTIMIRPSVVTPAKEEPVRGWVANWMGPTATLLYLSRGWIRCHYGEDDFTFEIIPVDYVVNLTIISAAKFKRSDDIPIYHSCTSALHPVTFKETASYLIKESCKKKLVDIPFPWITFSRSLWFLSIISFFMQLLPAYIADLYLFICGHPTRYVKMLKKYSQNMSALHYFSSRTWYMTANRSQELIDGLSAEDQKIFPCSPASIDWSEYMATYLHGVYRFLLK